MSGILEFIQEELKYSPYKSLSSLSEEGLNTSRTTFYSLMNNPVGRLDRNMAKKIIRALNLSDSKEVEFLNLVTKYVPDIGGSFYQDKIMDIMFSAPAFQGKKAAEIECFSDDNNRNRRIRSYDDIVNKAALENGVEIKIKIRNCLSAPSLTSIYALITNLRKKVEDCQRNGKIIKVVVEHILTLGHISSVGRISALLSVAHLIQFCNYSVYHLKYADIPTEIDNEKSIFDFLENTIALRLTSESPAYEDSYFVFHLSNINGKRDYCFESTQHNFYSLYRTMFNRLKSDVSESQTYVTKGAAEVNENIANVAEKTRRLMVKKEPCLDNISPSVMKKYIDDLLANYPQLASSFRKQTDYTDKYGYLILDNDFFDMQQHMLATRFKTNEKTGVINFYDANAFSWFIRSGELVEIKGLPSFNQRLLREQLMYMYKCVESDYGVKGKQQFYFLNNMSIASKLFINVNENKDICVLNEDCLNLINSNFTFTDPDVSSLMYIVLSNALPKRDVFSKEDALKMLRCLLIEIGGTEKELKSYKRPNFDDLED